MSGTDEGPTSRAGTTPGAGPPDVTRRDQSRPGLAELRDYRAAFAAAALPMAVVDLRGQVVTPNDALGGL
ncbi:histidine kinase, partial [Streptomyces sp. FT05W]